MRRRRGALLLLALTVATSLAAGCGSDASEGVAENAGPTSVTLTPGPDGVQEVTVDASDSYKFTPSTIEVKVGKVRLTMINNAEQATHSLAFKPGGPEEDIPFLAPGEEDTIDFSVDLPGEYEFFCTFHEALNQRGTLVVKQ